MTEHRLNRYIDHAVLKPDTTRDEAIEQITLGVQYDVRTVCVRPADIDLANHICKGTTTGVSCVLAFPHGSALPASKADEARRYVELGVAEIDMVVNYSLIRSGLWHELMDDIRAVTTVAKPAGVPVKTILETCTLTPEEIAQATRIAIDADADFVKTSTGFAASGASEEAVRTMLLAADGRIAVKASGGIRSREQAIRYVEMGCQRLGVGSSTTPVLCGAGDEQSIGDQKY